jgi:mannobiose 2-epimerase
MSISQTEIAEFRSQIESEWRNNIAPFWLQRAPDQKHGGFHGWITNDLQIDEQAEKGIILNSRIMWTFSRAHRLYQEPAFQQTAKRAYDYLTQHFLDPQAGGVYWTVDYSGKPVDKRKRVYAQAFALFAFTEYFVASGERAALDQAFELFYLLESYCRDRENDGYFETFERDWTLAGDQRLSEVDRDEKKSMNAHLHVLEAYANLAEATGSEQVKERLRAVIEIFLTRIIRPRGTHLQMFFDEEWQSKSDHISFGHDIEASWLLCEAAAVLADVDLLARVETASLKIAGAVYDQAVDVDGGLLYEANATGIIDTEKHWWAQTEAVVGFVNAYELSGDEKFLIAAQRGWQFIARYLIDRKYGEWFWKTSRAGEPALELPKLSQWKCPYHNGRMCFEVNRRLRAIEVRLCSAVAERSGDTALDNAPNS